MTEMALGAKQHQVAHVAKRGAGRVEKIGETRMRRADKAPYDPRHHQGSDQITGPDMQGEEVVLGQIGDGEGDDQRPVKDPYERIPDINGGRLGRAAMRIAHGCLYISHCGTCLGESGLGVNSLPGLMPLTLHLAGKI